MEMGGRPRGSGRFDPQRRCAKRERWDGEGELDNTELPRGGGKRQLRGSVAAGRPPLAQCGVSGSLQPAWRRSVPGQTGTLIGTLTKKTLEEREK